MPFADLPMPILFAIFLLLFVLLGVYPAWKKTVSRVRRLLNEQHDQAGFEGAEIKAREQLPSTAASANLNDYDIFVIRQLALAGGKGLSRRQLVEQLHVEPALIRRTLASLVERGVLGIGLSRLFGIRYALSAAGHAYAVAQGYIPQIH